MSKPFENLTIEQVATLPRPGTVAPGNVRFSPDGKLVTYLFSEGGSLVRGLWGYDIATGERQPIVTPGSEAADESELSLEEQLRRERARLRETGVTHYSYAKDSPEPVLLVPLGGRLHVRVGESELRALPGTEGALDARLDTAGRRVAFARGGELWVTEVAAGEPRQLTSGAEPGLTHGVAEFIAAEELDRHEGYWWSPDGSRLAFAEADERHIPVFPIVHQGVETVSVEEHRYPFAGGANARIRLGVVPVEGGDVAWMDLGEDQDIYLARVAWRPDGTLAALILDRDQQRMRWLTFDRESGASTVLLEETGDPWVNLSNDTRFLATGEMLVSSERDGMRHLYLHGKDGKEVRRLTTGEWVVTRLVEVDEEGRRAFFIATTEGPLERHAYAVSLDGGELERLTMEPGWHEIVMSPDCSRFVDTWSSVERGPQAALRGLDGMAQAVLFDNEGATAEELGLAPPRFIEVTAEDGTELHGALYVPPGGSAPYPLVVAVYGGPHAQTVANYWALTVDLRAQHLAQQGYLVLKLDNRGMANRGVAFEAALHLRMGSVEVEDQVAGVKALVGLGLADGGRVGVYGWSYGGYMTCMCLMKAPEVFRVGVAGAPVTDWDGYDTGYTERYMSTPERNPEGYREGSVLQFVDRLEGKLLLVHGMVDENVHFRHTARLVAALAAAQKPYDLLVFPEERHMPRDRAGLEYQERRVFEYLVAGLRDKGGGGQ